MIDDDTKDAKATEAKASRPPAWLLQHDVDLVTECEYRLFKADLAEKKNVTVPKEALRLLLWRFWLHPPNKLPLPSAEKVRRREEFRKYREELDRRVDAGEPYKRVLHELSQKAATALSGYTYSLRGPIMSITEKTAKRYIESPGSEPGKKKRRA
jgi:hypothetical protein